MRKLRRAVLRNEANRLSRHGRNGKSIAIFRSLWDDYKELKQHKELAQKEKKGFWSRSETLRGSGKQQPCKFALNENI